MGGEIAARSELGQGSRFTAWLPFELANVTGPAPAAQRGPLADRRVLIADDNATSRRILAALLTRWGAEVAVAASGAEALAALAEASAHRTHDALIVDQPMPEIDGLEVAAAVEALAEGARPAIILLASGGARLDPSPRAAIAAVILKPPRPSELLRALLDALGLGTTAAQVTATEEAPRPLAIEGSREPLRVLLAEDNRVNQILVEALLAKRHCAVTTVADGLAVVEAVQRDAFDLILMDVQMPELDGLEATRRIRDWERSEGRNRARIVALTAHAMVDDQARCLAAGMDAYLTKPLRAADLETALTDVRHAMVD
jgi:CheY-like chemotaxis protein